MYHCRGYHVSCPFVCLLLVHWLQRGEMNSQEGPLAFHLSSLQSIFPFYSVCLVYKERVIWSWTSNLSVSVMWQRARQEWMCHVTGSRSWRHLSGNATAGYGDANEHEREPLGVLCWEGISFHGALVTCITQLQYTLRHVLQNYNTTCSCLAQGTRLEFFFLQAWDYVQGHENNPALKHWSWHGLTLHNPNMSRPL